MDQPDVVVRTQVRQRQEELSEFEASLVCIVSSRPAQATQ